MTVRQLGRILFNIALGYCVLFTCLSWVSIKFPERVGELIDYVDYLESDNQKHQQVIIPKESLSNDGKPKGRYLNI